MKLKEELFKQCQVFVNKRLQTIEQIIFSNQKALQTETKSSAGDKHETGRAMLQLEMEKAGKQLSSITAMNKVLNRINIANSTKNIRLGSLVFTDQAIYFLTISAGQLIVENTIYFAISISSPIGKLLLGKKENDSVRFNEKTIKVIKVL